MVTFKELEILKLANSGKLQGSSYSSDMLPYYVFDDANDFQNTLQQLENKNLVNDNKITEFGKKELEGYRVNNAIILAAGGVPKNSKSIYSLPKGLYVKDGETLIEREIRQLQEVGISDITVVVGYRQELYFYLAEKCGVKLVCSPAPHKGNVCSLNAVADKLSRTYILNCDNFYAENPFSAYEFDSLHATVYKENALREVKVKTNSYGRIMSCYTDKNPGLCFYGYSFIDDKFSKKIKEYMTTELDIFKLDMLFWEELAMRHIEDFDMYSREYAESFIYEFDSIAEIQGVETLFINDVSNKTLSKICEVLKCNEEEIKNIKIIESGMTNILLTFDYDNRKYLFRYPGESSRQLVSRKNEVVAQNLASKLGLDTSCLYIDDTGCKLAYFRESCKDLSKLWFEDLTWAKDAARKMHLLHTNCQEAFSEDLVFDPIAEGDRLMKLAAARKGDLSICFGEFRNMVQRIQSYLDMDNVPKVLCHLDWKYDNVLLTDDSNDIIDWEYGCFADYGGDLLRLTGYYDFYDQAYDEIIKSYFGREATKDEKMHTIASWTPYCYYWLGWLMYQESLGEACGFWTIWYYQNGLRAYKEAIGYYEEKYGV